MARKEPMASKRVTGNFMQHLAPDTVHGTEIQGVDQAFMDQQFKSQRMREEREARPAAPMASNALPNDPYDWEKEWRTRKPIEKRKERGGATMTPQDMLSRRMR